MVWKTYKKCDIIAVLGRQTSMILHESLKEKVMQWRKEGYPSLYPALSEILEYQEINGKNASFSLRFLRQPQLEALEVYWFLRVVLKTPHIFGLYKKWFTEGDALLKALGVPEHHEVTRHLARGGIQAVLDAIVTDDSFVRQLGLHATREMMSLSYPSYILALAMGAGKTVLIGAIIATEFALALEYQEDNFIKNALVFAPGKTILGALKELSDVPYEKILPPRLYKQFIATVRFTYTRDGEKNIPIIPKSIFNIVVTNTEKIRITKQSITKGQLGGILGTRIQEEDAKADVANQRLKTLASLPHLGIFSDEAHHTYGQALDSELKQVRKTVDYLAVNTKVVAVVNTTGTPYYKRQVLKDVVYWYSLSQGIRDGILKQVRDNIETFEKIDTQRFAAQVVKDFFAQYRDTKIYGTTSAKLALYFPQTDDVKEVLPVVEKTLAGLGLEPSLALAVTNESDEKTKDLFTNRINDPAVPYRVFLLVNMGTEGWNVPSLFATALARKIHSSNNFVLQAASRCLRQVPGNHQKAKIYLSEENVRILDSELQETYGESLADLNSTQPEMKKERLIIRKLEIPPLSMKKIVYRVVPKVTRSGILTIQKPKTNRRTTRAITYTLVSRAARRRVLEEKSARDVIMEEDTTDVATLAVELSVLCRVPLHMLVEKLAGLYGNLDIPQTEADNIREQLETQTQKYEKIKEEVEVALALIRTKGFDTEGDGKGRIYATEIQYRADKEHLLSRYEVWRKSGEPKQRQLDFGFHYSPYNFDSNPEQDFFNKMLDALHENPADIEDIYFTGAMDDPAKTDFLFEYQDKTGKWHNYAPDFLIRKKSGKMLIVEVKGEDRANADKTLFKEKAMRALEGVNVENLKYEIISADRDTIQLNDLQRIKKLVYG